MSAPTSSPLGAALDQLGRLEPAAELAAACAEAGAVVHRPFTIPIGDRGVPVAMRVLGPAEELEATADFSERLRAAKILPDWLSTDTAEQMRARCYLARACRNPLDTSKPAGPPETWWHPAITPPIVAWLWVEYADLVVSHDPFGGALIVLDADDLGAIAAAIEKKSLASLAVFGSWKLARFLLTSAGQPATSPTPSSSDGSAGSAPPTSGES